MTRLLLLIARLIVPTGWHVAKNPAKHSAKKNIPLFNQERGSITVFAEKEE